MAERREFEGRSVDQALFRAAQELGRAPEDLEYEIIERGENSVRIQVEAGEGAPAGSPPLAPVSSSSSGSTDSPRPAGSPSRSFPRGGRGGGGRPGGGGAAHGRAGGRPGGRGDRRGEAERRGPRGPARDDDDEAPWTGTPLYPDLRSMVESVLAAGDLDLAVDIEQEGETDRVMISGPDTELLLADNAEPLTALEHILNKMALRGLGRRGRLRLDCEGRRKRREDEIVQMALSSAEKIKQEGGEFTTSPLNPYERRLVHIALKDDPSVLTHSVGEGFLKQVVISAKSPPQ